MSDFIYPLGRLLRDEPVPGLAHVPAPHSTAALYALMSGLQPRAMSLAAITATELASRHWEAALPLVPELSVRAVALAVENTQAMLAGTLPELGDEHGELVECLKQLDAEWTRTEGDADPDPIVRRAWLAGKSAQHAHALVNLALSAMAGKVMALASEATHAVMMAAQTANSMPLPTDRNLDVVGNVKLPQSVGEFLGEWWREYQRRMSAPLAATPPARQPTQAAARATPGLVAAANKMLPVSSTGTPERKAMLDLCRALDRQRDLPLRLEKVEHEPSAGYIQAAFKTGQRYGLRGGTATIARVPDQPLKLTLALEYTWFLAGQPARSITCTASGDYSDHDMRSVLLVVSLVAMNIQTARLVHPMDEGEES